MPPRKIASSDVFINVPFDQKYERVFLSLISGLVGLGLNPRCVLEVPASEHRLMRLYAIIRECPFSLHDLSRVQQSRAGRFCVPRFNMPFEMGLAVAVSLSAETASRHDWRVLEEVRHRVSESLSDVAGYDPSIHGGTVRGTLEVLLDIFHNVPNPPVSDLDDLLSLYRGVRRFRTRLRADIYRPNAYRQLVVAARALVEARLPR